MPGVFVTRLCKILTVFSLLQEAIACDGKNTIMSLQVTRRRNVATIRATRSVQHWKIICEYNYNIYMVQLHMHIIIIIIIVARKIFPTGGCPICRRNQRLLSLTLDVTISGESKINTLNQSKVVYVFRGAHSPLCEYFITH